MKLSYVMKKRTQELSQDNLNTQKWNPELQSQNIFTSKCKIQRLFLCVIYYKIHIGDIFYNLTKQCDYVTQELWQN